MEDKRQIKNPKWFDVCIFIVSVITGQLSQLTENRKTLRRDEKWRRKSRKFTGHEL